MMTHPRLVLGLVALTSASCARQPNSTAPTPTAAAAAASPDTSKKPPKVDEYKKITDSATTMRGLFVTHRVGEKLYFEIPRRVLGKEMLLVGRYTHGSQDAGAAGERFASMTLRWNQAGKRIVLRKPTDITMADSSLPVYKAVTAGDNAPILASFDIVAWGPDSAAVIDVTKLYTSPVNEFVAKGYGTAMLDPMRTYVERVLSFPENVEVQASQTMTIPPTSPWGQAVTRTVLANWSMIILPEKPMMPRYRDDRVGFIPIEDRIDYSDPQRATVRRYIARFRLEKKDPSAEISEPVKPIVYYIDPNTPDEWKPWVKKGVEEWQPAFEAAGFKNAIIAADPPKDDPNWSMEDVRHTMVRWIPSRTYNAYAEVTGLQDPRSGETINGSVFIFHNVNMLIRNWYFAQVGHLDPRAQQLPFPNELMGRILQFVIAHEVGHAIGLNHDQIGSSTYPADSVRSKTWTAKMGHAPSIMDYSRFNYVAQPEDGIAVEDLTPRVGPYDKFAIRWGYKPIPEARTPDAEVATLDRWAMEQDTVPWFRWAEGNPASTAEYYEAVGDADAVWATGWGIKNLQRTMKLLPKMLIRPTADHSDVEELYIGRLGVMGQYDNEMNHVVAVVAGANLQEKSGSQPGDVYTPNSRKRQADAVRFINEQAFKTPLWLIDHSLVARVEPAGMVKRINDVQTGILSNLIANRRLARLVDYEARAGSADKAYTIADLMGDVRKGIWNELSASRVTIDIYRRELQSAHINQLKEKLNAPPPNPAIPPQWRDPELPADGHAAVRSTLVTLRNEIRAAISRATDAATRAHLQTSEVRISDILDPKK
jgi:hypothetical protein